MSQRVDLYNNAYQNYASEVYRQVRLNTYGEDFGQTSWVTTDESKEIPRLLAMTTASTVLEVGCGSGGYALHLAESVGCKIVGLDINEPGVQNANQLAKSRGLDSRARFEQCDASKRLPFEDSAFDAVFSNDVLCHLPNRQNVMSEMFRVLKPGRLMLFSDALIVGGLITHEEIATRSSIGFYVYSPPGSNEALIAQAGFRDVRTTDTTANAAHISKKWYEARALRETDLLAIEGEQSFNGLQTFLDCVHTLTSERRLIRNLYVAAKPVSRIYPNCSCNNKTVLYVQPSHSDIGLDS